LKTTTLSSLYQNCFLDTILNQLLVVAMLGYTHAVTVILIFNELSATEFLVLTAPGFVALIAKEVPSKLIAIDYYPTIINYAIINAPRTPSGTSFEVTYRSIVSEVICLISTILIESPVANKSGVLHNHRLYNCRCESERLPHCES